MDVSGLYASTPFQCRHDSGFGGFPKPYGLAHELSPIRKQPSSNLIRIALEDFPRNYGREQVFGVEKVSKKLHFASLSDVNNSSTDSGIVCNGTSSTPKSEKLLDNEAHHFTDINCNLLCTLDCTPTHGLYQPFKYICKDHEHEKAISKKQDAFNNESEIFRSYLVTSELIKQQEETRKCKLDILDRLDIINCTSITSNILSYLSDEELTKASCVSKIWQSIILDDRDANRRRKIFIRNKRNAARSPNKENGFQTASPSLKDHKTVLQNAANAEIKTKQPLIFDNLGGRFDSFFQELRIGGQHALMKCPKCCYSARAEVGYKYCCTRNLCKHEFCKKCLGPYLDNHVCSVPELNDSLPKIVICSKKSRKNLRRL